MYLARSAARTYTRRRRLTSGPFLDLALLPQHIVEQIAVQVDAMGGVAGVLVALEPIASQAHDADLAHRVGNDEQVPRRQ